MDIDELGIMAGVTAALIGTGGLWKPVRMLSVYVAALTLFALWRYGSVLATVRISRGEHVFIGAALLR